MIRSQFEWKEVSRTLTSTHHVGQMALYRQVATKESADANDFGGLIANERCAYETPKQPGTVRLQINETLSYLGTTAFKGKPVRSIGGALLAFFKCASVNLNLADLRPRCHLCAYNPLSYRAPIKADRVLSIPAIFDFSGSEP